MPNSVSPGLISSVIAQAALCSLLHAGPTHSYNCRKLGELLCHVFNGAKLFPVSSLLFYLGHARIGQVYLNQHQIANIRSL